MLLAFTVTGCASIVSKSAYPVTITSTPDQAQFIIKNKNGEAVHNGTTPSTITLKSGRGYFKAAVYTIVFSKPGYADQTVVLSSKMDKWYIGNLLFGGLVGFLAVDPTTGAMYKLPENITTTLSSNSASKSEGDLGLKIVMIDDVPAEYKSKLIRIK